MNAARRVERVALAVAIAFTLTGGVVVIDALNVGAERECVVSHALEVVVSDASPLCGLAQV